MRRFRSISFLLVILLISMSNALASSGSFVDIPSGYWAEQYIQWVKDRGISTGYNDGTFRPGDTVTREQMATFIIRALYGENFTYNATPYFSDVASNRWSFKYVQKLKERGITTGCGGDLFCPDSTVTRAQMAIFLIRALFGENFTYPETPYFSDVPSNHFAFKYIQKLKELGLTTAEGTYRPNDPVTRADMATFLYRAFGNR